jgi:hypothetical protein
MVGSTLVAPSKTAIMTKVTNTLAYCNVAFTSIVESFVDRVEPNVIKLFTTVINKCY